MQGPKIKGRNIVKEEHNFKFPKWVPHDDHPVAFPATISPASSYQKY